jgi:hypothetical protein
MTLSCITLAMRIIGVSLFLLTSAFGQSFSVGVRGGVPFTGALSDLTTHGVDTISRSFSDSNQYIIGPMVELHLPLGLSVEADALYRPLNLTTTNQIVPQPTVFRTSENVSSWEFPILGKIRLPIVPLVKPYVDAGPSFRVVGSDLSFVSSKGFTAGLGLELKISRLRIAPEVRYTRWGSDTKPSVSTLVSVASNTNQGEFLVGISF